MTEVNCDIHNRQIHQADREPRCYELPQLIKYCPCGHVLAAEYPKLVGDEGKSHRKCPCKDIARDIGDMQVLIADRVGDNVDGCCRDTKNHIKNKWLILINKFFHNNIRIPSPHIQDRATFTALNQTRLNAGQTARFTCLLSEIKLCRPLFSRCGSSRHQSFYQQSSYNAVAACSENHWQNDCSGTIRPDHH